MIVGISRDLLKFLALYTSTLVAFGLAFHVVSPHVEQFEDPISAVLCVLAMMVGEISFLDSFANSAVQVPVTTQVCDQILEWETV